jgi:hypothetical protein
MPGGSPKVEAGEERPPAEELGRGPEDELLVELAAAAGEVAADQTGVLALDVARCPHGAGKHQAAEAGRELLEAPLDPLDHDVGRHIEPLRHVRVDVQGVPAGRRPRVVME